jgi:ribulose phosphate 3-epimerase family protein
MAGAAAPLLVASVLPADFAELGHEVSEIEKAGVDRIQWDVMDGSFVPNITVGPDVIASCRSQVDLEFEAHLMVSDPDPMLSPALACSVPGPRCSPGRARWPTAHRRCASPDRGTRMTVERGQCPAGTARRRPRGSSRPVVAA